MMRWGRSGGRVQVIKKWLTRDFSRARAENVKRVNPKVPFPEAISISQSLYQIIKQNGPLTVSNTWIHAKDANITGLKSKTHMKLMLKWMRGKNMLKLFCTHVGSNKKFLHSSLPEEPQPKQSNPESKQNLQNDNPSLNKRGLKN